MSTEAQRREVYALLAANFSPEAIARFLSLPEQQVRDWAREREQTFSVHREAT